MNKIWIEKPSPKSLRIGTGWFANINHVYKFENKYVCLTRDIETKWGKVTHCAIRNASSTDIPWAEKQWIKDTLFGEDRVAIEVFPRKDRLIDEAPFVYKPMQEIIDNIQDTVEIKKIIRPIYNFKAKN